MRYNDHVTTMTTRIFLAHTHAHIRTHAHACAHLITRSVVMVVTWSSIKSTTYKTTRVVTVVIETRKHHVCLDP